MITSSKSSGHKGFFFKVEALRTNFAICRIAQPSCLKRTIPKMDRNQNLAGFPGTILRAC